MVAHPRELTTARAAGKDIVYKEGGAAVSFSANVRPKSWPEGQPIGAQREGCPLRLPLEVEGEVVDAAPLHRCEERPRLIRVL
jgi:hypothetical protein